MQIIRMMSKMSNFLCIIYVYLCEFILEKLFKGEINDIVFPYKFLSGLSKLIQKSYSGHYINL